MSTIKEALAALDVASAQLEGRELCYLAFAKLKVVRVALEAAQRESEAWQAIEAWLGVGDERYYRSVLFADDQRGSRAGKWRATMKQYGSIDSLFAPTRLEALTEAAAWARSEMNK